MNKSFLFALVIVFVIAVLSGSCRQSCVPGYSGRGCAPDNQKVTGTYIGTAIITADGHSNPPQPDTLIISAGTAPDSILINNSTSPIKGYVTGSGSGFIVASQSVIYSGVTIVIGGSGALSGDTLTGLFTGTQGGLPFSLSYSGVRQ